jgi:hypothetical protein
MIRRLDFRKVLWAVLYSGLILSFGLVSCQKVITINLNSVSPQIVVEGNVSNIAGPFYVKLSQSVSFTDITDIPAVKGATVVVSDSSGGSETLTEIHDGIYKGSSTMGIPGHKYTLTVESNGVIYESVSRMPFPVNLLSLGVTQESDPGRPFGSGSGIISKNYVINYEIKDPAEYKNYYRFVVYHGSREINSRRVFSDQYHNGKLIINNFDLHDTTGIKAGDTIIVALQNIDQGTYNFFRTLRDGAAGMTFLSASPSNPISNISNNALGYFSTFSVSEGILIIPE